MFCLGRGVKKLKNELPSILDVMKNYVYVQQNETRDDTEIRQKVIQNLKENFMKINPRGLIVLSDKTLSDKI